MISYFTYKFESASLYTLTLIFMWAFAINDLENYFFIDFYSSSVTNLSWWDSIYLSWTSVSYIYLTLPIVLSLVTLTYQVVFSFYLSGYRWILVMLFTILFLTDVFSATNYVNFYVFEDLTNALLSNSLNKYHPFLLYLSIFWLMSFIPNLFTRYHNVYAVYFSCFLVIYYTMFMGSWWAYQEGSWGGWWAWDPSEVFGLLIFYFIVNSLHRAMSPYWHNLHSMNNVRYLLLVYFLLQSSFGLTSHDFGLGLSTSLPLNVIYVLLALISAALIIVSWLYSHNLNLILYTSNFPAYTQTQSYLVLLLVIAVSPSLIPLLTDLLWKLLYYNLINSSINYNLVTFWLWVIIFLSYTRLVFTFESLAITLILIASGFLSIYFVPLVLTLYLSQLNWKLHALFLCTTYLSLTPAVLSVTFWDIAYLTDLHMVDSYFSVEDISYYLRYFLYTNEVLLDTLTNSFSLTTPISLTANYNAIAEVYVSPSLGNTFYTSVLELTSQVITVLLSFIMLFMLVVLRSQPIIKC